MEVPAVDTVTPRRHPQAKTSMREGASKESFDSHGVSLLGIDCIVYCKARILLIFFMAMEPTAQCPIPNRSGWCLAAWGARLPEAPPEVALGPLGAFQYARAFEICTLGGCV